MNINGLIDFEIENDEEYFAIREALRKYERRRNDPGPDFSMAELQSLVAKTTENVEKVGRQIRETCGK